MTTQADHVIVRAELIKTHDKEPQQKLEAWGRSGERFGGTSGKYAIPRVQYYGFTAHAPPGSQGIAATIEGNPDMMMMVGMEHPEHRPKDLAEGEWKLYEIWGGYLYAQEDQWIIKVGGAEIRIERGGVVHINP